MERVQHRFIRMFPGLRTLPYADRLQFLKETKPCRSVGSFQDSQRWSRISFDSMFTLSETLPDSRDATSQEQVSTLGVTFALASERVIERWNRLPHHWLFDAQCLQIGLDRLRSLSVDRLFDPLSRTPSGYIYSGLWNQVRPHVAYRPRPACLVHN